MTKLAKLNIERRASWAAEDDGVYLVGNVAEEVGHGLAIMRSPVPSTNIRVHIKFMGSFKTIASIINSSVKRFLQRH